MHPFKSFWERLLRDGDSGGGMGGDSDADVGDPGADPMGNSGGQQGVGAGGSNASGSGSNAEGAGSNAGTGAGVGAEGSESPSTSASENVGANAAASVGTAPGTAPGTTASSNVGTTAATESVTSQEENATVSSTVDTAPQGFANVSGTKGTVSDAMTEEEAMTAVTPGVTPSMSTSVAANVSTTKSTNAVSTKGTATVGAPNPNNPSISAENVAIDNATQQAIANLAEQLGVTGPQMNEMLGTGQVSVDANVSGSTATATATANNTDNTSTTGGTGTDTGVSGSSAPSGQGSPSGPTGDATAPGATPGAEATAPGGAAGAEAPSSSVSGTDTAGTGNAATGSTESTQSGSESGEGTPDATAPAPTQQSFSSIGSPSATTSGVTSMSDILGAIAGVMSPIGSAQAQTVDPNTGGVGGGQGQQGQVDEDAKSTVNAKNPGQSFGNIALGKLEGETGPNVQNAIKNAIRSLVGAPQVAPPAPPALPGMPGMPGMPGVPGAPGVVTPTPPPLPWAGQTQAPPLSGVEAAGIAGAQKGVVGGTPKGFAGVAPAQPPAPAMPPSTPRNRGMIGPPTAVSVPKGFPGGIGVSPSSSEETKEKVEALVAPKTVQQILNAPPIKTYPAMPPANVPGVLDRMGKGQPGVMSQSGDGTGGPSTPGAKGQNPGVPGQVTQQSPVPALPTNFGNVAPAPPATPPSVVPALPMPASITTTQQPTEETMPAATIDKSAPQSFRSAEAAANKSMNVKEGMTTIGRLREQAVSVLGNPNASEEDQAAAKSYLDRTEGIANPGPMDTRGVAPSVQANQQKQGTAKGIAGNPSVGLIDKAFVGPQVNPVTLETKTNIPGSISKVGSYSGIPGVSTAVGLASRGFAKWGGSTQGATLGQEEAPAGTPGATTPWGGDDGYGDTRGDNSGFGRIAGLSSGARLAEAGYDGVSSFASIGSTPLAGGVDYGLIAGDAFSALGYSLPGEVDDPGIPEIGRRKTNSFLLRRVS